MNDKCETCGAEIPADPLGWLLRYCQGQVARLKSRAAHVCPEVRASRPVLRIDENIKRWEGVTHALEAVVAAQRKPGGEA